MYLLGATKLSVYSVFFPSNNTFKKTNKRFTNYTQNSITYNHNYRWGVPSITSETQCHSERPLRQPQGKLWERRIPPQNGGDPSWRSSATQGDIDRLSSN